MPRASFVTWLLRAAGLLALAASLGCRDLMRQKGREGLHDIRSQQLNERAQTLMDGR